MNRKICPSCFNWIYLHVLNQPLFNWIYLEKCNSFYMYFHILRVHLPQTIVFMHFMWETPYRPLQLLWNHQVAEMADRKDKSDSMYLRSNTTSVGLMISPIVSMYVYHLMTVNSGAGTVRFCAVASKHWLLLLPSSQPNHRILFVKVQFERRYLFVECIFKEQTSLQGYPFAFVDILGTCLA